MKKKLVFATMCFVLVSVSSFAQIKVNSSGRVGVGVDPNGTYWLNIRSAIFQAGGGYPDIILGPNPDATQTRAIYPSVDVAGAIGWNNRQFWAIYGKYIYQNGSLVSSDKRLKENFRSIEKPLEKLIQLNGMKYDFIKEKQDTLDSEKAKFAKLEKDRMGFVAQDLEKIFPEAVFYDEEIDRYYIEYNAIIPVIVEAMKEQQAQIEELKNDLADCCETSLKNGTITGFDDSESNGNQAKLYQNNPNPFSTQTAIRFEIPETIQSAQLHICNMTGTLLKTITLNQRDAGNEFINANEFVAGMYLYSLVCDGKIVDTKQMLLTE